MAVTIKNKLGGAIFSHKVENCTVKTAVLAAIASDADLRNADLRNADLRNADLRNADLRNANLSDADLRNADLRNANLRNAIGNMKEVFLIQTNIFPVTFTHNRLQVGCKNFTHEEWRNFDEEQIAAMDSKALEFWKKYKKFIFTAIELSLGIKN